MEWITVNIYKVNYCFTLLRRTHIDVFYSMMRWRKKSESLAWNRILYSFHSLVCYIRFFVEWKERNNMRVGGNGQRWWRQEILVRGNLWVYMYNTSVYLWSVCNAQMDERNAKISEKREGRLITSNSWHKLDVWIGGTFSWCGGTWWRGW